MPLYLKQLKRPDDVLRETDPYFQFLLHAGK